MSSVTGSPPDGTQWISVIQPALTFLLIGVISATLLLPLLIALVTLSTPASRKHVVFSFNVVAISLGLLAAILHSYVMIHSILSPTDPLNPSMAIGFTLLMSFTPLVVECILLLRLLAVFPPRETPLVKLCAILFIPVATKVTRLILLGLFAQCYVTGVCSIAGVQAEILDNDIRWAVLYIKTTWFLQLIDNTFVSIAFLYQLRRQAMPRNPYSSWSLQTRLKGLFYIALTSYIFPTLCGIVELVLIYAAHNLVPATCVLFFDIYISIFGVAFATVWTTGVAWIDGTRSATASARGGSAHLNDSVNSDRTAVNRISRRQDDKEPVDDEEFVLNVLVKRDIDVDLEGA